jgi:hypothetical protein
MTSDADLKAWVERHRGDSFRAFALCFRKRIGHPMDEWEYRLAELAHSAGWHDGLDAALRFADDERAIDEVNHDR